MVIGILKFVRAIGIIGFFICWLLMAATFAVGGCGVGQYPTFELPVSDVRDVAVDSQGRIYVLLGIYRRVQRYSPEGEYQLGWRGPYRGDAFVMRTISGDLVQIATSDHNLYEYTTDGRLLCSLSDVKADPYTEYTTGTNSNGPYRIAGFDDTLIVDSRTGRIVIETKSILRFVAAPFRLWLNAFALWLLGFVADRTLKRIEQRRSQEPAVNEI